jgi:phosphate/sulfate permease
LRRRRQATGVADRRGIARAWNGINRLMIAWIVMAGIFTLRVTILISGALFYLIEQPQTRPPAGFRCSGLA